MLKSRQEIKQIARERLRENHGAAILILLVYSIVAFGYGLLSSLSQLAGFYGIYWLIFLIGTPLLSVMLVNVEGECIKLYKGLPASVGAIFTGFSVNFWRKLGGMMWMFLWVMLWSFLLFIPGIIKGLAYSMTPFILAKHPEVKATEALKLSMRITDGYKGTLFVMYLSFLGWQLLSTLTLGILGIVFVTPYFFLTCAGYFVELRDHAIANGKIRPEELGMPADVNGIGVKEEE